MLNVQCDLRAKNLTHSECQSIVLFHLDLFSTYLSHATCYLVLKTKESAIIAMSISQAKDYVSDKLKIKLGDNNNDMNDYHDHDDNHDYDNNNNVKHRAVHVIPLFKS